MLKSNHNDELARDKEQSLNLIAAQRERLTAQLHDEKQNSFIALQNEKAASRYVLKAMEKKLDENVARERKYRNDAIEHSIQKCNKKIESIKSSKSTTGLKEKLIEQEHLLEEMQLSHKNEISSFNDKMKNLEESHREEKKKL